MSESPRSSTLSDRERIYLWSLAVLGLLGRLALAFRSDARIATRPYIEDSFYAMSCARQLALGHGFTVDGVHAMNGVQPLICLLYAPCYLFTDSRWIGLRLTFLVTALLQFAGTFAVAYLVAQLRRKPVPSPKERDELPAWLTTLLSAPVIAAIVWTFSIPLLIHHANGLETGLYGVLLLVAISLYLRLTDTAFTPLRSIGFGVVLGLAVLARIDAAVLVVVVALWDLVESRGKRLIPVALYSLTALLVSAPWWIYNFVTFGSFMPISGQSEAIGTPVVENFLQTLAALADLATLFFYHNFYWLSGWLTVLSSTIVLGVVVLVVRFARRRTALGARYELRPLRPFVLFSGVLAFYYIFLFSAPHFIARYLEPMRVLWVVVASIGLSELLPRALAWKAWRSAIYLALGVVALFSVQRYVTNFTTNDISELYRAGKWAELRPTKRIGMDQSGTASFVADNVVNLDGKVNFAALTARKNGTMPEYLAREQFAYLADWPEFVHRLVLDAGRAGLVYNEIDSIGHVHVFERYPPAP